MDACPRETKLVTAKNWAAMRTSKAAAAPRTSREVEVLTLAATGMVTCSAAALSVLASALWRPI